MRKLKRTLAYLLISITSGVIGGWYLSCQRSDDGSCSVNVFFSPNGGCTERIVSEIDASRSEIRVQAFAFNSEKIADALIRASERGVEVRCIFDKSQIKLNRKNRDLAKMLFSKVKKFLIDSPKGYAHSKVMIIDDEVVITGSFNWTNAAEYKNVENLLVIRDANIAALYRRAWQERCEICEKKQISIAALEA